MKTRTLVSIIILIAIIAALWWLVSQSGTSSVAQQSPQEVATASFACSDNESITATFYESSSTPPATPGMPPTPGGSVALVLSDGRSMTLPQTLSADGARYANADESLVFWNKGNTATITEGTQPSYTCIEAAKDPGGLGEVYESGSEGFSLRYPAGYTVDPSYTYTQLADKTIHGTKFQIPNSLAEGTNLGADSYVSVEQIPQTTSCDASLFTSAGTAATSFDDAGTTYSAASSSDAGAGNRYEERIFAIPGTNPCIAVRYFIHYSVFENYPAGTVTEFDEPALLSQFDAIRRTLTIAH